MGEKRRHLIQHLKEKDDAQLTKRLLVDAQLLAIAHQEIKLKRRALEQRGKKHEKYVKSFADSMKTLTNVISNGFDMLQG